MVVDGITFHPDELASAKVKRDGTVVFAKTEKLNVIDPIDTRKSFHRTLEDALFSTAVYNKSFTRKELAAHQITILDKLTGRKITQSRKEWSKVLNRFRMNRTFPTFSEFCEIL